MPIPVLYRRQLSCRRGQRPSTVVLLGDSITGNNGPATSGANIYTRADGYFTWANAILGHPFTVLANSGNGGDTIADMQARIQTDVLDYRPGYCMFLGGVNDINVESATAATVIARLKLMYDSIRQAGIKLITSTITPANGMTAGELAVQQAVNAWIVEYAAANRSVIFADMATPITDVDGYPKDDWTDNTHPYGHAAYVMGAALAEAIRPHITIRDWVPLSDSDPRVLNANSMMAGDTGGIATGYSVVAGTGGTIVAAKVARTDGKPGAWQRLNQTVKGSTAAALRTELVSAGWSVGDTVYGVAELKGAAVTDQQYAYLRLRAQDVSYATKGAGYALYQTDDKPDWDLADGYDTVVMRTPDMVVPADSVYLRLAIVLWGVQDLYVGRMAIVKP